MLQSTIFCAHSLGQLTATLARVTRLSPDAMLLDRTLAVVENELDRFERAFDRGTSDLPARAQSAYFAALQLAGVLVRISAVESATRATIARFTATAHRMLAMLAPLVAATDRMLATRLLDGGLSCLH